MSPSDERGIAIVMALFMTLIVSALGASMAYVARTETQSSQSYTTMAQARYAAESGLAAAANYLLSSQYAGTAPGTAADPMANYTTLASPVTRPGGGTVELSTQPGASNYPVTAVVDAFRNAASGTLTVSNGTIAYGARARLLAMRQLNDPMSGGTVTLQTWEIAGIGRRGGMGSAEIEVTAIIDRQTLPAFRYAAFATGTVCGALSFEGGATTRSYNSNPTTPEENAALVAGSPVASNSNGDVGTNGNLALSGSTTQINGTLSTPRSGVGSCTANNVTSLTVQGNGAEVSGGLVELPQVIEFPTPPAPSPTPPTTSVTMDGSFNCSTLTSCVKSGSTITITPTPGVPYVLGNVAVSGGNKLVLEAGTYVVNSLSVTGNNTQIQVTGGGPVIINVAGQGQATPINLAGNSLSNPTFDPALLQFVYGGANNVSIAGGTQTAALVYAPNANLTLTGNSDFYGAVVGGRVTVPGSAKLNYDTSLSTSVQRAGNPVMSSFTWRTF